MSETTIEEVLRDDLGHWRIVDGPREYDELEGLDMVCGWTWDIESRATRRTIEVIQVGEAVSNLDCITAIRDSRLFSRGRRSHRAQPTLAPPHPREGIQRIP